MSTEDARFSQWTDPDHALIAGALWPQIIDAVAQLGAVFDVPARADVDVQDHTGDYLNSWTIRLRNVPRYRLTLTAIPEGERTP